MHCSSFDIDGGGGGGGGGQKEGDVLVAIASMILEGRIPGKLNGSSKGFYEGPHCPVAKNLQEHRCNANDKLCNKYNKYRNEILSLWQKRVPLCLEVLLVASCSCENNSDNADTSLGPESSVLLEQWVLNLSHRRPKDVVTFNLSQLIHAIRSQLHFSQISAWLSTDDKTQTKLFSKNFQYRISTSCETFDTLKFKSSAEKHQFPLTDVGGGYTISLVFLSLPRTTKIPNVQCSSCPKNMFDDGMHSKCTLKGKHCCEDFEEDYKLKKCQRTKEYGCNSAASTSQNLKVKLNMLKAKMKSDSSETQQSIIDCSQNDLNKQKDKGQLLLDAIIRSGQRNASHKSANGRSESDSLCDNSRESDIFSINKMKYKAYIDDENCDKSIVIPKYNKRLRDISNLNIKSRARQKLTFEDDKPEDKDANVPSASEQAKFRKDLDSAASMVFHSRTGLPLTSSPAPVRRGKSCFDFDSSINSVSAIRSALFSSSFITDDDSESDGSVVSPCSPEAYCPPPKEYRPVRTHRRGHGNNLLGSFEESVLNGRLEPVSTVHGFQAELGASGSFVPQHLVVPVTVFFYTLGDNDKVSSPYLAHINLGKKGYNVPRSGTVQVTLFNPLGTVVKMFVIMYNLADMPPNSQTFIRQRTLYMPTGCEDDNLEWGPKWLRFLIHLRFMSSKSGKIYLHSDIRMIIFRKSDLDTATAHGIDMSYELRSFTHMPSNPRFSPRK